MVIGIPRGMSFYNNYPFWYGFFSSLGIKIVLSDPTTKQTMSEGSALVVTETCLPIKIYLGHILNLINKGVKTSLFLRFNQLHQRFTTAPKSAVCRIWSETLSKLT